VTVTGTNQKPIFVGIARQSQVDNYLRGAANDEITDFELDPFSVTTSRHTGTAMPAAPAGLDVWKASATGAGLQSVTWQVQKGSWAVVVMNADSSRAVATHISVGAKLPFLLRLGVALLAGGGIAAMAGGTLIYAGIRRPTASTSALGLSFSSRAALAVASIAIRLLTRRELARTSSA
jgi:hypothetical protein